MAWCNANDVTNKTNHTMKLEVAGSLLERRSRGVTTLHHYKRISSRDLGWHQRETEEEEVKQSCFFDKRVKPMNLERLKSWMKEHNIVEHNWEHSGRKEKQGTPCAPWRLQSYEWRAQWTRRNWNHSGWNEIEKEQEWYNLGSTPTLNGRNWTWT